MNIKSDYYDKSYNYILDSVIEYLGGIIIKGHYANLCKLRKIINSIDLIIVIVINISATSLIKNVLLLL